DEVAQYAEGHRITSYLPLGDVKDKDEIKHNWLWTTVANGSHNYEFDSFRVFVWSIKRHRYETAFIDRNAKGYYPVVTEAVPGQESMGFSLIVEDKDGQVYKKTFAFSGYHVRMVSKLAYDVKPALPEVRTAPAPDPVEAAEPASGGIRGKLSEWKQKWLGR